MCNSGITYDAAFFLEKTKNTRLSAEFELWQGVQFQNHIPF